MALGELNKVDTIKAAQTRGTSRVGRKRGHWHQDLTAYLFLAPFLILFGLFTFIPAIAAFVISFLHWNIIGTPTFVGLQNFIDIFHDPLFVQSLLNTFYFMLISAIPLVALGLGLAMLVNQKLYGRTLARAIVYLPQVVMISAVGIIWVWMYDQNWGLINYYLGKLGIPAISWLSSTQAAMPALAITTIWWTVGSNMILYLAGLQDIPEELYEAARIDGASRWRLFWNITWPQLKNVNAFVIPLTVIACWRVFGQAYVMTSGGPQGHTFVVTQYIYQTAFQNFQMGPAAAAAVVLLIITLVFTISQLRVMRIR